MIQIAVNFCFNIHSIKEISSLIYKEAFKKKKPPKSAQDNSQDKLNSLTFSTTKWQTKTKI